MAILFIVLAVGLGMVALFARDEGAGVRVFWLACCLLNGAAAAHMIATGHEHAWSLPSSTDEDEPSYRR